MKVKFKNALDLLYCEVFKFHNYPADLIIITVSSSHIMNVYVCGVCLFLSEIEISITIIVLTFEP